MTPLCMASAELKAEAAPLPPLPTVPASSDQASSLPANAQGENQPQSAGSEKGDKKEEGISTERKIAGYAVLAFLLVWMFIRSGKNKLEKDDSAENAEEDSSDEEGEHSSSDAPKN